MEGFRHKAGILAAIFCLIVILAVVWFCLSGGLRQKTPEGTLVRQEEMQTIPGQTLEKQAGTAEKQAGTAEKQVGEVEEAV